MQVHTHVCACVCRGVPFSGNTRVFETGALTGFTDLARFVGQEPQESS